MAQDRLPIAWRVLTFPDPGALRSFGWDDRVLSLYNDLAHYDDLACLAARPARVVRVERSACVAVTSDGEEGQYDAEVLPAVGDWVAVEGRSVRAVLPRRSVLTRGGPEGEDQVLAANVDLVLVVVPADRPNAARAERELALAWDSGARPVVIVTKGDIPGAEGVVADLGARLAGVDIVLSSSNAGLGVDEVHALLAPSQSAVLLGPSGAGKSTLVNALLGRYAMATAEVRTNDARGRHTTTSRQLLAVPGGGVIIDTPGLRSLALVAGGGIQDAFSDVGELAGQCRFSNCSHQQEPGCAVRAAVSSGQLDQARLANFTKLQKEATADLRRHDPVARKEAQMLWKQRSKWQSQNGKRKSH